MGAKAKPELKESDVTGLNYFDKLAPLLSRLHDDGCQRDRAGNRKLHYDQYSMLMLLYLFNPIVTSLRGILRIATNLLDVPAETIALLFAKRWAIETFFRFFKHMLGCRHLLKHDRDGIAAFLN